jgi:hypothetical protein
MFLKKMMFRLTFQNRGHHCRLPPNHSAAAVGGCTGGIIGYSYWLEFGLLFIGLVILTRTELTPVAALLQDSRGESIHQYL